MSKILFDKATSNKSVTIDTSSTVILASNTNRVYALIVNDSNATIYLAIGVAAVLNKGIRINANGGSYEVTSNNLNVGSINGISAAGGKNVTVTEA